MIGQDHVGVQRVVIQVVCGIVNGLYDRVGDFFALEPGRATASFIKITIQPDERLTAGEGAGRRESVAWQAAVQMPGQEQILAGWLPVR